MTQPDNENVRALAEELHWLKQQVRRHPTHWAYSRIAEIEGLLAAYREEVAWVETQKVIKKLQAGG
jgi:hypothetical protein